jgi:hypothetical protein
MKMKALTVGLTAVAMAVSASVFAAGSSTPTHLIVPTVADMQYAADNMQSGGSAFHDGQQLSYVFLPYTPGCKFNDLPPYVVKGKLTKSNTTGKWVGYQISGFKLLTNHYQSSNIGQLQYGTGQIEVCPISRRNACISGGPTTQYCVSFVEKGTSSTQIDALKNSMK